MVTINGFPPLAMHADAQAIAAGEYHSMVLKYDGTVWATGDNKYGELGDGTTTNRRAFVQVVSSGQCGTMVETNCTHIPTLLPPPSHTLTHAVSPSPS